MQKTENLLKNIKKIKSEQLHDLLDQLPDTPFEIYLEKIIQTKHMKKSEIISRTTIQRNYAYQIFDGSKKPNKDKVIQLSLALHLDLKLTNNLLSLSNNGALYPKMKRDALIIYCIENHYDVISCNALLYEYHFPCLD